MAHRGRRPRGDRESTSFAAPREHLALYRAAAQQAGIPLGDYLVIELAKRHELEIPDYYPDPARRQLEMPMGA